MPRTASSTVLLLLAVQAHVAAMALAQPADGAAGPGLEGSAPLRVEGEATWVGEERDLPSGLVVAAGARLEVRGSLLRLGGPLHVEEGGELRLGPQGEVATRVVALDAAGFHVEVNGTLEAAGLPATQIDGLSGAGLESVFHGPGGVKVFGTLRLTDAVVRNGTAGVIVREGGLFVMERGALEDLYFMGVTVLGRAELRGTQVLGNIIGVTGKDGCEILLDGVLLRSMAANVQINGCRTEIRDAQLLGASNGLVTNGRRTTLWLNGSVVDGYVTNGLRGDGDSRIEIRDTTFRPGIDEDADPRDQPRRHAVELMAGHVLRLDNVTASGHLSDGVLARSSDVEVRGGAFFGNGGHGVRAVGGTLDVEGARFADTDGGRRNAEGPLSWSKPLSFQAVDPEGAPLAGLEVDILLDGDVVASTQPLPGSLLAAVQIERFGEDAKGNPVELGPFRYEARHPALERPRGGEVDLAAQTLRLTIEPRATPPWLGIAASGVLGAAGVALLVYALWRPRRREAEQE